MERKESQDPYILGIGKQKSNVFAQADSPS